DATHVHSPTGGQGMNSGLIDAPCFLDALSLASKGVACPSLLESYTAERVPVIRGTLGLTTDTLGETLAKTEEGWNRGSKYFQLDVNYRGSPVVLEERGEDVPAPAPGVYTYRTLGRDQAGDRAPDAPPLPDVNGSAGLLTNLFSFFKIAKHTVLIFTASVSSADAVVDALREYPTDLVQSVAILPATFSVCADKALPKADFLVKDTDRHAYEGYLVNPVKAETTIIIVHPDTFVGSAGSGVGNVKGYFSRIFA
ncbi:hypothetical protein GLOTRDRAFT_49168, partial [Gloeophyllum trabeum ATCC 11539]